MEFLLFCIGIIFGGTIMLLDVNAEKNMNRRLMRTINNLETDLNRAIELNKQYEEDKQVLLKIIEERSIECK